MEKILQINGESYERIEKPSSKQPSHLTGRLASVMAMAQMFGGMDMYGSGSYSRELPSNVDIVKEFELIQQKKSKLSKWEREKVVRIFNQNFKKITP